MHMSVQHTHITVTQTPFNQEKVSYILFCFSTLIAFCFTMFCKKKHKTLSVYTTIHTQINAQPNTFDKWKNESDWISEWDFFTLNYRLLCGCESVTTTQHFFFTLSIHYISITINILKIKLTLSLTEETNEQWHFTHKKVLTTKTSVIINRRKYKNC